MDETSFDVGRAIARLALLSLAGFFAAAASACTVDLGDDTPRFPPFADVTERCSLAPPDGVDQNGPFSLAFAEGSTFVFGETIVGSGATPTFLHSTTALAGASRDPCAPAYVRAADGQLATLIDLSEDELAADSVRTDGRQTVLWPVSGLATSDDGVVFYQKVLFKSYFDFATVGIGAARLGYGQVAERLTPNKFPGEPTLTWLSPQTDWGSGALVAADGLAYVYGCYARSQFDYECRVARVAPGQVGDPDAYRYFAGDSDAWVDRVEQAAVVLRGATHLSGVWSAHLGAYVFVHSGVLENDVYATTAPNPWGPFSEPSLLFVGVPPAQFFISDVNVHAGFDSADGRRLLVSYHTAPEGGASSVHFMEAVLR